MSAKHIPTDEQRGKAYGLAYGGTPEKHIAAILGIGRSTLRKHYKIEIEKGRADLVSRLTKTAADIALGGDKTMLIFLCKTLAHYRETERADDEDADEKIDKIEVTVIKSDKGE